MKETNKFLLALMALLLPVLAWGQNSKVKQAEEASTGKEVRLHKVVYYKIRESDNVEYAATTALHEVAEFMEKYPDAVINLVGYADRGTGNPTLNVMYALNRATKFKNDLISRYGVNPNRILADSKGDIVQPFSDNDKNRCVIVEGIAHEPAPNQASPTPQADNYAQAQRRAYYEDRDRRYDDAMGRHRVDTIVVMHKDTLWIGKLRSDSLKPERPLAVNHRHTGRNWFVQAGIGAAIYQGDHNRDAKWGDRIYSTGNFSLGKWIFPALGVRAGVDLDRVHMMYHPGFANDHGEGWHHQDGVYEPNPALRKLRFNAWNFRADVLVNLSAFMWAPYEKRILNIIPYAGLGRIAVWDDAFKYSISLNAGLMLSLRLSEHFDLTLDARAKKFADDLNWYENGHKRDGIAGITLGATWYFTKRGF